ncbi:MAG: DUF4139 domain-containing protein [Allosphingosinicella sp.]
MFLLLLALLALRPEPAAAQARIASPAPVRVAVTIYRNPDRPAGEAPNLRWLGGFALVSETRTISIPAGEAEVRFEGVAGGIVPQSAIVTGFPEGIVERNRDALLLSPGTLIDRSLGRRVTLRRTSLETGAVREYQAVARSGAGGLLVLETEEGFEALRCTGLRETLLVDEVPPDLNARPTLSVRVRSAQPLTATVTLSYIATGFDWQADYIAQLSDDGQKVDLFAWLTLASTDETSFSEAETQAVAGWLNWQRTPPQPREGGPIQLNCWPHSRTSDIPLDPWGMPPPPPPPPPAPPPPPTAAIVVTGARIGRPNLEQSAPVTVMTAEQEELGDLKLYRIPEPVTVAANSQKQVALLRRTGVQARLVHRHRIGSDPAGEWAPARRLLVTRNRTAEGLGLPLLAGNLVLFSAGERRLVIGEGEMRDRAIGEEVEVEMGEAPGVRARHVRVRSARGWTHYRLEVANDGPRPVAYEAEIEVPARDLRSAVRLERRRAMPLWKVNVPANGTATLDYRVRVRD